jgi:hypothetical protein
LEVSPLAIVIQEGVLAAVPFLREVMRQPCCHRSCDSGHDRILVRPAAGVNRYVRCPRNYRITQFTSGVGPRGSSPRMSALTDSPRSYGDEWRNLHERRPRLPSALPRLGFFQRFPNPPAPPLARGGIEQSCAVSRKGVEVWFECALILTAPPGP